MSYIEELVAELCPQGVQFKALDDIAVTVAGLSGKSKADFSGGSARYVSYKNAFANLAVDQDAPDFVEIAPGERQNQLRAGDIVFTGSSESLEEVGMSSVVTTEPVEPLYLNSFCFVVRLAQPEIFDPEFSKYLFRSSVIRKQICASASGVTRINVSKARFMKTRVPVPPIKVQHEIVKILDQFAEVQAELEAKLDAELELRRKQHQHYRKVLLSGSSQETWPTCRLGEVCDIVVGFPFKSAQFSTNSSDIPLIRGDNVAQGFLKRTEFKRWSRTPSDGLDRYELCPGDVVLAMDRPWIPAGLKWAKIGADDTPALLVQRVARLRALSGVIDPDFLACVISSGRFAEHILNTQTGNTVPHISSASIAAFTFSLPPLEQQTRIASTLESFDFLAKELSTTLHAEIAARRNQYWHYRDRLVTFEEATS